MVFYFIQTGIEHAVTLGLAVRTDKTTHSWRVVSVQLTLHPRLPRSTVHEGLAAYVTWPCFLSVAGADASFPLLLPLRLCFRSVSSSSRQSLSFPVCPLTINEFNNSINECSVYDMAHFVTDDNAYCVICTY